VLCFLVNKFGKVDVKSLKTALFDFYDVDALYSAKGQLLEAVDGLNLTSKRPHVPRRRDGDGRQQICCYCVPIWMNRRRFISYHNTSLQVLIRCLVYAYMMVI